MGFPGKFEANYSAVVAMDWRGVVHFEVFQGWLNTERYLQFLKNLKLYTLNEKIALFYDGLSVHLAKPVKRLIFLEYQWLGILNEAY